MNLISQKNFDKLTVVNTPQFEGFANYINQLILKSFGLYAESRLDILVNHIKTIGAKAEQFQIPGPFTLNDF